MSLLQLWHHVQHFAGCGWSSSVSRASTWNIDCKPPRPWSTPNQKNRPVRQAAPGFHRAFQSLRSLFSWYSLLRCLHGPTWKSIVFIWRTPNWWSIDKKLKCQVFQDQKTTSIRFWNNSTRFGHSWKISKIATRSFFAADGSNILTVNFANLVLCVDNMPF